MSKPLTDADLDRLAKLAGEATEPPYEYHPADVVELANGVAALVEEVRTSRSLGGALMKRLDAALRDLNALREKACGAICYSCSEGRPIFHNGTEWRHAETDDDEESYCEAERVRTALGREVGSGDG